VLALDRVRIEEVFSNLISNALLHTPSGGSISVSAEPVGGAVAFTVADTGTGIGAEELPHVFERFAKSPASGGSGLGLAIAKSLVEAHGGTIAAESRPGIGTTVRLLLPRAP
jgi:signal transduction histidine kinase